MKTIWCLFSIACDYNQPDFNLECWWNKKPDVNMLFKIIECDKELLSELIDKEYINISGCNYTLTQVKEGVKVIVCVGLVVGVGVRVGLRVAVFVVEGCWV